MMLKNTKDTTCISNPISPWKGDSTIVPLSWREPAACPNTQIIINIEIWNWKLLMSLDLAANHANMPNADTSKIIVKLSNKGIKVIGIHIATIFFTLDFFLFTP